MRRDTLCVLGREEELHANRSLVSPIYQTAVWTLDSVEECESVYAGEKRGFIYTRDANPNHEELEATLARLEGAESGVVFASGMAALAAVCTGLTGQGSRIVAARGIYGVSIRLMESELSRFGVETTFVDAADLAAVRSALAAGAALLLAESVSNPLIQVADLPALAELAHSAGALFAVDNTFPSPYGCTPLSHGADIVIHSVTKFLGGHSDLTLGAVLSRNDLGEVFRRQARLFGGAANPFEAWLARRGLATLHLRMERGAANALLLAERLHAHPAVAAVHYPGLPGGPQEALAGRVLRSPGAMLSFELDSGAAARALIRSLRLIRFAPSLGDVATTVSYPAGTSHRAFSAEEREALGIGEGLVRLSAGVEHGEDLWDDLEQALR